MNIRCKKCDKLLAKDFSGEYIELKCPRCGAFNITDRNATHLTDPYKSSYSRRDYRAS